MAALITLFTPNLLYRDINILWLMLITDVIAIYLAVYPSTASSELCM